MHLTDEQLNEYLDYEMEDSAALELHLSSCMDCTRRLDALRALFDELVSLSDEPLSTDLAGAVMRELGERRGIPRALRLAVTLQAAAAALMILVAAPFVTRFLDPYLSRTPSLAPAELFLALQAQWRLWLAVFSEIQRPAIPAIPVVEWSTVLMTAAVIGASVLWLVGNGMLLRNQLK